MIRSPLFTSRSNVSEQQYIDDSAENICVHLYLTDGKTCFLIFFYMRIINFCGEKDSSISIIPIYKLSKQVAT
jgi:hypothetical protein